jgi:hypothetical protein
MTQAVIPLSLKDEPALIERLLPVQKLSAEAYKEQMANVGKTLRFFADRAAKKWPPGGSLKLG